MNLEAASTPQPQPEVARKEQSKAIGDAIVKMRQTVDKDLLPLAAARQEGKVLYRVFRREFPGQDDQLKAKILNRLTSIHPGGLTQEEIDEIQKEFAEVDGKGQQEEAPHKTAPVLPPQQPEGDNGRRVGQPATHGEGIGEDTRVGAEIDSHLPEKAVEAGVAAAGGAALGETRAQERERDQQTESTTELPNANPIILQSELISILDPNIIVPTWGHGKTARENDYKWHQLTKYQPATLIQTAEEVLRTERNMHDNFGKRLEKATPETIAREFFYEQTHRFSDRSIGMTLVGPLAQRNAQIIAELFRNSLSQDESFASRLADAIQRTTIINQIKTMQIHEYPGAEMLEAVKTMRTSVDATLNPQVAAEYEAIVLFEAYKTLAKGTNGVILTDIENVLERTYVDNPQDLQLAKAKIDELRKQYAILAESTTQVPEEQQIIDIDNANIVLGQNKERVGKAINSAKAKLNEDSPDYKQELLRLTLKTLDLKQFHNGAEGLSVRGHLGPQDAERIVILNNKLSALTKSDGSAVFEPGEAAELIQSNLRMVYINELDKLMEVATRIYFDPGANPTQDKGAATEMILNSLPFKTLRLEEIVQVAEGSKHISIFSKGIDMEAMKASFEARELDLSRQAAFMAQIVRNQKGDSAVATSVVSELLPAGETSSQIEQVTQGLHAAHVKPSEITAALATLQSQSEAHPEQTPTVSVGEFLQNVEGKNIFEVIKYAGETGIIGMLGSNEGVRKLFEEFVQHALGSEEVTAQAVIQSIGHLADKFQKDKETTKASDLFHIIQLLNAIRLARKSPEMLAKVKQIVSEKAGQGFEAVINALKATGETIPEDIAGAAEAIGPEVLPIIEEAPLAAL